MGKFLHVETICCVSTARPQLLELNQHKQIVRTPCWLSKRTRTYRLSADGSILIFHFTQEPMDHVATAIVNSPWLRPLFSLLAPCRAGDPKVPAPRAAVATGCRERTSSVVFPTRIQTSGFHSTVIKLQVCCLDNPSLHGGHPLCF